MLIPRIRLLNRQIADAHRQIDRLTISLATPKAPVPDQRGPHDATILASLPGVGRIVLATLLAEAWDPLQRRLAAYLERLTV